MIIIRLILKDLHVLNSPKTERYMKRLQMTSLANARNNARNKKKYKGCEKINI